MGTSRGKLKMLLQILLLEGLLVNRKQPVKVNWLFYFDDLPS